MVLALGRIATQNPLKTLRYSSLLIVVGLFTRYLVFLIKYKYLQKRRILPWLPGPSPYPLLGSLQLILREKTDSNNNPLVHHALMHEARNHNGIFGLWMGAAYTVVITKPAVAEEAYCTSSFVYIFYAILICFHRYAYTSQWKHRPRGCIY